MEPIIVARIMGVATPIGVVLFESKGRDVMEAKIDALTEKVGKRNQVLGRNYRIVQDMFVARNDIERLRGRVQWLFEGDAGRTRKAACPVRHEASLASLNCLAYVRCELTRALAVFAGAVRGPCRVTSIARLRVSLMAVRLGGGAVRRWLGVLQISRPPFVAKRL